MSVVSSHGLQIALSSNCSNGGHIRCKVNGCECKCHMLAKVRQ